MATVAWLRPPAPPAGGGAVPAGSAGVTVSVTVTPDSGTVPQLVTVTRAARVDVGGSTVGVVPGTVDCGSAQEVEAFPDPPDGTAGGVEPDGGHHQLVEGHERGGRGQGGGRRLRAQPTRAARWPPGTAPTPRVGAGTGGRWAAAVARRARNCGVGLLEGQSLGRHLAGGLVDRDQGRRRPVARPWSGDPATGSGDMPRSRSTVERSRAVVVARRSITWVNRADRSPDGRRRGDGWRPARPVRRSASTAASSPCSSTPRAVFRMPVIGSRRWAVSAPRP